MLTTCMGCLNINYNVYINYKITLYFIHVPYKYVFYKTIPVLDTSLTYWGVC
jgi:hypothetical protein